MIAQPGVLDIDDDPVFLVFDEQVKPTVDRADGRGKGFFGFDPVDLQVQAEEVLDEGGSVLDVDMDYHNPLIIWTWIGSISRSGALPD